MRPLAVLMVLLAAVNPSALTMPQPAGAPIDLRYVANAGVLLSVGPAQVLIDAPIRDGIAPYATSDRDERDRLERALPPYDRIAAILVTHWHEDHFSPEAVAAHLSHNPRAVLISSPEVVERVRAVDRSAGDRLRAVLPAPGASALTHVSALPIRVLRIRHNRARRFPEQHVGFLIGEPAAVLPADAAQAQQAFDRAGVRAVLLARPGTGVTLAPTFPR